MWVGVDAFIPRLKSWAFCCYDRNSGVGGYVGGGTGAQNGKYASGGGGGAPVFIYYTGSYVNNGTINTAGGFSYSGRGGAGGIKTTKISI